MTALTEEQERAISQEETSVALRAGAGCGKTTVLTERYLRELSGNSPRPLPSIVALTFTDKAARELRERIRRRCYLRLSDPEADRGYWRSILLGLDAAPIGTFHSYCGQILRRHAIEIGLDPEFEIADEQIAPILRDEAVTRSISQWLSAQDASFLELAIEYGIEPIQTAISDGLRTRGGLDLEEWSERDPSEILANWELLLRTELVPALLRQLIEDSAALLDFLRGNEPTAGVGRHRREVLLAELPHLLGSPDPLALLKDLREQAKVQGDKKTHWQNPDIYESVKDLYEAFRGAVDGCDKILQWDPTASLAAIVKGQALARLIVQARTSYAEIKRARGLIDFDDQMILTRDLLRAATPQTLMAIRARIEFLLVDEFQDTDPTQVEILRLLQGRSLTGGGFYIVGDRKQSIYRFRNARPQLFDDLHDAMPEQGQLRLSANFRSHPTLITWINALFDTTFPGESLRAGLVDQTPNSGPRVELLAPASIDSDSDDDTHADHRRATEATWIARLLRNRLDQGWLIRDPESPSGQRHAHAGDVAILLGNMNHTRYHEQALASVDLDYHVIGGKAFYSQQEVIDLVNILSAIEDPTDSLAMAGCLRGPFFGVSDQGLYQLTIGGDGDLYTGLWVESQRSEAKLSDIDLIRVQRARRLLDAWRIAKDRLPIATFVRQVLDEAGYEPALLVEHLGERKLANVRKLVDKARSFDERGGFTLNDFVARLRLDLRKTPDEAEATTTDEAGEAVKILTIHKAKGLEFPIVVIPDLNRKANSDRTSIVLDWDLGVVVKSAELEGEGDRDVNALGWLLSSQIKKSGERQEALRLFYVAVTRAQDDLILSSTGVPKRTGGSPAQKLLSQRFNLESGAFLGDPLTSSEPVSMRIIRESPPEPATQSSEVKPKRVRPGQVLEWLS